MDVEKFVRHLCRLVLRHQMPVWNYFVNSFYSVDTIFFKPLNKSIVRVHYIPGFFSAKLIFLKGWFSPLNCCNLMINLKKFE